jgi:Protein of unknown function (DUF3014)
MSRYDRNRAKKTNNTTFTVAIMVSLLIGISGMYYVANNVKTLKEVQTASVADKAPSTELNMPQAQEFPVENELELLPVQPSPQVLEAVQPTGQASDLPDLLSSDGFMRQALLKISPGLAEFLNTDQLIRKLVFISNDFAQGLRIAKHMSFLRFEEQFSVEQGENGAYIAAKSSQRYNKLAQAINLINAKAAVAVYQKFRPLMLQVFAEFSYPEDITLESTIKKAAGEIIAAPAIEGEVALERPSVYYKFADPKLEALSPVQKQVIRMGPTNTRLIQAKCREFLVELAQSGL